VKNDEQIFLAVVTNTAWDIFCDAFGFGDLKSDSRLQTNNDRVRARDWMMPVLRERMAQFTAAEISAVFEERALPYAPITRPQELFDDPHLNATGSLADIELPDGRPSRTVLLPLTLDGERPGVRYSPPKLGEHNAELLGQLGYSPEQIQALTHPQDSQSPE
jgi:crotonobetainyl-CoA:carnitine CoA-transferase CaiB-like acyl-CoA transferase